MTQKEQLESFVLKFRKWLFDNYSEEDIKRNFYDDAGYPHWGEIEKYFSCLLESGGLKQLDKADKVNLLYLIARHWDIGSMINWMSKEKRLSNLGTLESADFIDLAEVLVELESNEYDDAKIQFVEAFKKFDNLTREVKNLLLKFYNDNEIDIRGRALLSLGKLKYSKTIELLEKLWEIDEEFNKMKCLSLIDEYIKDRVLMTKYLYSVENDKRENISEYVKRMKKKYKI